MSAYGGTTEDEISVGGLASGAFAVARSRDGRDVRANLRRIFGRLSDGALDIWAECFGGIAEVAERLPLGADGLPETGGGAEREFLRGKFASLREAMLADEDGTRLFPFGDAVVASGSAGMRVFDPEKATTAWAAEHCLRNADALWGNARERETLLVELRERRFRDASRNYFSAAPRLVVRVLCGEAPAAAGFDLGRALRKTFPKPPPRGLSGGEKTSRAFVDVSEGGALAKRLRGESGAKAGAETLERVMVAAARSRAFRKFASMLPEREREVVVWRAGVRDGYRRSLAEVGKIFNVPAARVREVELSAFRRLIV